MARDGNSQTNIYLDFPQSHISARQEIETTIYL